LISLLLLDLFFRQFRNKEIKVCLCSPGKNENRYIKEFVEHYKNYGVDKIFLYDNNDLDGEYFEQVINNYIQDKFVKIINFRGKKRAALDMMNDCYRNNFKVFDWLIFFEIDEYIFLKDIYNIKTFLSDNKFLKCQRIQLNWVFHTDNNLLYYENRTLKERFPEIEENAKKNINIPHGIKSILRGHIPNIKINCIHTLNHRLKSCDGFGNYKNVKGIVTLQSDYRNFYIDHYNFKSTEEFIKKINFGDIMYYKDNQLQRIKVYFLINKFTEEKIKLMEKATGLNLSEIRNRFMKIIKIFEQITRI
jgi:hypothetical protein